MPDQSPPLSPPGADSAQNLERYAAELSQSLAVNQQRIQSMQAALQSFINKIPTQILQPYSQQLQEAETIEERLLIIQNILQSMSQQAVAGKVSTYIPPAYSFVIAWAWPVLTGFLNYPNVARMLLSKSGLKRNKWLWFIIILVLASLSSTVGLGLLTLLTNSDFLNPNSNVTYTFNPFSLELGIPILAGGFIYAGITTGLLWWFEKKLS